MYIDGTRLFHFAKLSDRDNFDKEIVSLNQNKRDFSGFLIEFLINEGDIDPYYYEEMFYLVLSSSSTRIDDYIIKQWGNFIIQKDNPDLLIAIFEGSRSNIDFSQKMAMNVFEDALIKGKTNIAIQSVYYIDQKNYPSICNGLLGKNHEVYRHVVGLVDSFSGFLYTIIDDFVQSGSSLLDYNELSDDEIKKIIDLFERKAEHAKKFLRRKVIQQYRHNDRKSLLHVYHIMNDTKDILATAFMMGWIEAIDYLWDKVNLEEEYNLLSKLEFRLRINTTAIKHKFEELEAAVLKSKIDKNINDIASNKSLNTKKTIL